MSFTLFIHDRPVSIKHSRFPAGESYISFDTNTGSYPLNKTLNVKLSFYFQDNGEVMDLALIVDALRRNFSQPLDIVLDMPYIPYGRQDRACNDGESFSLKVFGNIINSLGFTKVLVNDAHSDVAGAVIDNLDNIPQHIGASNITSWFDPANTVLVSPDAGALKKIIKFAQHHGYKDVVRADKIRDITTGKITETVVYSEPVGDKNFLIVDDICDGGASFIPLANKLKELTNGKVNMFVTHGIFSKGPNVFDDVFDTICYHHGMNNLDEYKLSINSKVQFYQI